MHEPRGSPSFVKTVYKKKPLIVSFCNSLYSMDTMVNGDEIAENKPNGIVNDQKEESVISENEEHQDSHSVSSEIEEGEIQDTKVDKIEHFEGSLEKETGSKEVDHPILKKSSSFLKRSLQCAGSVEEKCHPNPNAKRCKLQEVLTDKQSTASSNSEMPTQKESQKPIESVPNMTSTSNMQTIPQTNTMNTNPIQTSMGNMPMNYSMPMSYDPSMMNSYQAPNQVSPMASSDQSYYTMMNSMDPATFNYCMQMMMQMMQNPMFMQQMQMMMNSNQQMQMMNSPQPQGMYNTTQMMNSPQPQGMYNTTQMINSNQPQGMYNTTQMMDPAMQNMVNNIISSSVSPPPPPSPPASLVTIPQRKPEDFTEDSIEDCKLFVGGMPSEVTEPILRQYFQQFGPVRSVTIVKNRETGASRGFGFVTFVSKLSMQDVLSIPKHEFFGKKVDMHKCTPNNRENSKQSDNKQYKIFVGSLDDSITEEMLRDSLNMYGQVTKVDIIRNNEGRHRGFAFVHFSEQTPVDMLLTKQHMNINGRKVVFGKSNAKKH